MESSINVMEFSINSWNCPYMYGMFHKVMEFPTLQVGVVPHPSGWGCSPPIKVGVVPHPSGWSSSPSPSSPDDHRQRTDRVGPMMMMMLMMMIRVGI